MKKAVFLALTALIPLFAQGQIILNPNISEKSIQTLSISKVVIDEKATSVTIQIRNSGQQAPFSLKTRELFMRPVSDPENYSLIRADKAPFAPDQHVFNAPDEVFEFTLVFPLMPKGTKYVDILDKLPKHEFYLQGIILDTKLNDLMSRGFEAFGRSDVNGALKYFMDFANADLYFEYGIAYFNIIYILVSQNRFAEAQEWYDKWKDRFFYDKKLLESQMNRYGMLKNLK